MLFLGGRPCESGKILPHKGIYQKSKLIINPISSKNFNTNPGKTFLGRKTCFGQKWSRNGTNVLGLVLGGKIHIFAFLESSEKRFFYHKFIERDPITCLHQNHPLDRKNLTLDWIMWIIQCRYDFIFNVILECYVWTFKKL